MTKCSYWLDNKCDINADINWAGCFRDCPDAIIKLAPKDSTLKVDAKGKKYDSGKARWDLLPMRLIDEVVDVLSFGADKYGEGSWRYVENGLNRYYAALMRHIRAYREGEENDLESGLSHLAHAMCNIIFLSEFHYNAENNNS